MTRWVSPEYDKAYKDAMVELDPVKRAALFIHMNDLVCTAHNVIPIVDSAEGASAISNELHLPPIASCGQRPVAPCQLVLARGEDTAADHRA